MVLFNLLFNNFNLMLVQFWTYFEIGPDLNKPYVQVVKHQVKMHQDNLHEILVKLHIKFI